MDENNPVAPRRHRRHSDEFKAEAIKACLQPGVSIAAIALHYRLNANMLRTWVAGHKRAVAGQERASTVPRAEFVPLQLAGPHETAAIPDIVIEIIRGGATITIRWPHAAAADCAGWLHGWLR
ncbi:MAG: transposase [Burkholderiaceae bacterium]|nr:transposase [Burkholderiaceae bacterium]